MNRWTLIGNSFLYLCTGIIKMVLIYIYIYIIWYFCHANCTFGLILIFFIHASLILKIYTQHYLENLPERNPEQLGPEVIEACKKYILKCAELSWLMVIQDPPMCMEWQFTGSEFKSETMRSFTKSGDQVQFVVWPALYLHDNGALVAKAIVQGMKTEKKGRKNQKWYFKKLERKKKRGVI